MARLYLAPFAALILCSSIAEAKERTPIDPLLFPEIRDSVQAASEAELDPKRGTQNAVEILKAEKKRQSLADRKLALDLRIAGTILRARFLSADEFPVPRRYQQALSTYSRLDLTEPGINTWLDRTFDHHPEAKKKNQQRKNRVIRVGFLLRGSKDVKQAASAFERALKNVGVRIERVPAESAPFVIKLAFEEAPRDDGTIGVRVTFGVESVSDKRIVWRSDLYRTEAAKDFETAKASALDWVARIGGRDLFFRFVGETYFPKLIEARRPGGGAHAGHGHGVRSGGLSPVGESVDSQTHIER